MKFFTGVTVSNCRVMVLHFSGLYILVDVVIMGKMYNLKNCPNLCYRMLTVIPAPWQVLVWGGLLAPP